LKREGKIKKLEGVFNTIRQIPQIENVTEDRIEKNLLLVLNYKKTVPNPEGFLYKAILKDMANS